MIDTSNWKKFRVGDLFDIHPTKAYKMTNAELLDDGDTPVVANSAYNNGICGYSTRKPTEKGNMVTFSDTVDANTIFYQPNDFIGYSHIQGLYPIQYKDKWNEYTYSFFVSVFRGFAISKGFDYGNKFRKDIAVELIIKLPATSDGRPDWDYMESYMKGIMEEIKKNLSNLKEINDAKHTIDIRDWGNFRIGDIFDVVKGTRLKKTDMEDGPIKFVGASASNNGETARIANKGHLHPPNTLTVCYNGSNAGLALYQDEEFWASDDVNVLYPKFEMNQMTALFICPVIKTAGRKYAFTDKWKQETMKDAIIMLPVASSGEPDWAYMEKYMERVIEESKSVVDLRTEM